ncbi:MAG: hypothetical protein NVSMB62_00120 [Acidobacteriaceae bacterium]
MPELLEERTVQVHPLKALIASFNWKTAAISAILRGLMFFFTNLRSGHILALRATQVEACFAICASGVFGAITQRIRDAQPAWVRGLAIWCLLPLTLLTVQFFVHRAFGTPQLKASMIVSFCFAAVGTGFNWFAMRRGALLVATGEGRRSFLEDLRAIPILVGEFVMAPVRGLRG